MVSISNVLHGSQTIGNCVEFNSWAQHGDWTWHNRKASFLFPAVGFVDSDYQYTMSNHHVESCIQLTISSWASTMCKACAREMENNKARLFPWFNTFMRIKFYDWYVIYSYVFINYLWPLEYRNPNITNPFKFLLHRTVADTDQTFSK